MSWLVFIAVVIGVVVTRYRTAKRHRKSRMRKDYWNQ